MGQLIVQKYGGSSVADPEKIKNVARRVAESAAPDHRMVVVVSAMGKTTDGLLALAAALKADVCEIFTDVDGVYTADPNVVPDARKLARVSYDEMLEMASLGAKVLQSRSVEFAKKYGVSVHVRSTFKPDPGTLVTREDHSMEEA